jgi:hypothetical protein
MSERNIEMEIVALRKDFDYLVKDFCEVKTDVEQNTAALRVLQDAQLTQPALIEQVATEVISRYTKSKSMKIQNWAPYITILGAIIIALLPYIFGGGK